VFASWLSVRLCVVYLIFQVGGRQFFHWEDMMEQMPTIHVVPEVAILRDRMYMIVNHIKWIEKLVCVHNCCSLCNTNEVDGNVSV
jgi:hypothetical protein